MLRFIILDNSGPRTSQSSCLGWELHHGQMFGLDWCICAKEAIQGMQVQMPSIDRPIDLDLE